MVIYKWKDVFERWNAGIIPEIPRNITKPYLWRTSVVDKNKNNFFIEEFIEDKRLIKKKQNFDLYRSKPLEICSKKHKNKLVTSSINLQKDTMQVVPLPVKGKNFANMYYFVKNADIEQQKAVWKKVVIEAEKMLKKHNEIYISSQGLGIDYFHVKISTFAKFYGDSKLKNKLPKSEKSKMSKKYKNQTNFNKMSKKYKNQTNLNKIYKKSLKGGFKKKDLLHLYEKNKLFAIDITSAESATKSKNKALKIANEKGLKYLMVCDYTEFDTLYDVKTKKKITDNKIYSKYFNMVKGDKPGHGCKIPISIEKYDVNKKTTDKKKNN